MLEVIFEVPAEEEDESMSSLEVDSSPRRHCVLHQHSSPALLQPQVEDNDDESDEFERLYRSCSSLLEIADENDDFERLWNEPLEVQASLGCASFPIDETGEDENVVFHHKAAIFVPSMIEAERSEMMPVCAPLPSGFAKGQPSRPIRSQAQRMVAFQSQTIAVRVD